jgi:hypothetical protein
MMALGCRKFDSTHGMSTIRERFKARRAAAAGCAMNAHYIYLIKQDGALVGLQGQGILGFLKALLFLSTGQDW